MIQRDDDTPFEISIPVVIVGAGACGLTAALAASDAGAEVLVIERDPIPMGTTSMSSGLIPAAGTRAQQAGGVTTDSIAIHAADIMDKTKGAVDFARANHIAEGSATTIDWLIERHGIPLTLVDAAKSLPGHSVSRLHGTPNRTGSELIAALQGAVAAAGVDVMTDARVTALVANVDNRVTGVEIARPDGTTERIGCGALILASAGFAGNTALVARHIPEIAGAVVHTHPGAQGDALTWGIALGAATGDLTAYQGHANLTAGYGLLVQWISMGEGGVQVNAAGHRFADESRGYSENAVDVVAQPGGTAWAIYDARIDGVLREFAEYRDVISAGALRHGADVAALAAATGLPAKALAATLDEVGSGAPDRFGRHFLSGQALAPPYVAVKVTGALFHTQGGLEIDRDARVVAPDGRPLPNLFAGGGAARGVSGPTAAGYIAGNGLMTATTFGRLAGTAAARIIRDTTS